jgi:hypothetical protein
MPPVKLSAGLSGGAAGGLRSAGKTPSGMASLKQREVFNE